MPDKPAGIPDRHHPPDLLPVPTVAELVVGGLAYVVEKSSAGTYYRITKEGRRRITEAMAENSRRRTAWLMTVTTSEASDGSPPPAGPTPPTGR